MKRAFLLTAVALVSACSSMSVRTSPTAESMAGIKTIQVTDRTDPVMLKATGASLITELVETAIQGKGYQTCKAPCEADATATVKVTEFAGKTQTRPGLSPANMVVTRVSVIEFTVKIAKAGTTVMETASKKKSDMVLNTLSARMVQDMAELIPEAK